MGVAGELYIGGEGVARGYLNRADLTAEHFVPDPFLSKPAARMYRTGDLVRWRTDGTLGFLGRLGNQIKLRGFRIELGEIEAVLLQAAGVAQAIVHLQDDGSGDKRLVAYVIPVSGATLLSSQLRSFLQQKLPDYMVPSVYVTLASFPVTPNGKVDRKALPKPDAARGVSDPEAKEPRDEVEFLLVKIWEQVLGIRGIGVHDSFFDLGGHSLLALRLFLKIRAIWGKDLPLATLF